LFTLLLLTLFVDASYIRAIRITSFLEKNRTEQELIKLQEFTQTHNNLEKLEKRNKTKKQEVKPSQNITAKLHKNTSNKYLFIKNPNYKIKSSIFFV